MSVCRGGVGGCRGVVLNLEEFVKQLVLDGSLVVGGVGHDVLVRHIIQARHGVQVARVLRVVAQKRHRLRLSAGVDVRAVARVYQDLVVGVNFALHLFAAACSACACVAYIN